MKMTLPPTATPEAAEFAQGFVGFLNGSFPEGKIHTVDPKFAS
jgi:hypothetical protein